jgi:hypothetical protein
VEAHDQRTVSDRSNQSLDRPEARPRGWSSRRRRKLDEACLQGTAREGLSRNGRSTQYDCPQCSKHRIGFDNPKARGDIGEHEIGVQWPRETRRAANNGLIRLGVEMHRLQPSKRRMKWPTTSLGQSTVQQLEPHQPLYRLLYRLLYTFFTDNPGSIFRSFNASQPSQPCLV